MIPTPRPEPVAPRVAPIAFALLLAAAPLHAQVADSTATTLGRRYLAWLEAGHVDSLVAVMTPAVLARVGGTDGVAARSADVNQRLGAETELLEEGIVRGDSSVTYRRRARFARVEVPVLVTWELDAAGRIVRGGLETEGNPPR